MRPVSWAFVPSASTSKLSPPPMRKDPEATVYVSDSSIGSPSTVTEVMCSPFAASGSKV